MIAIITLFGHSLYSSVPTLSNPVTIDDTGFRLDGGSRHVVLSDVSGKQLKVALIAESGKSLHQFPILVTRYVFGYPFEYQAKIGSDYEKELIEMFNDLNIASRDEQLNTIYLRLNGEYKHEENTGVIYSIYSTLRLRN